MELDHGVWQETITASAATGQSRAAQDDYESRAHAPFDRPVTVAEPPSRLSFWFARLLGLEAFYVEPVSQGSLGRRD